jgi:hypothetical protein
MLQPPCLGVQEYFADHNKLGFACVPLQVDGVMLVLRQSIAAGEQWKELYKRTQRAVAARGPRPWDFDTSSIFAHIDAFLQV